jgi:hypothetical protein
MATEGHRGKTNFALPALFRRGYTKAAVRATEFSFSVILRVFSAVPACRRKVCEQIQIRHLPVR